MKRGVPDRQESSWKEVLTLDRFFKCNKQTFEKTSYAERLIKDMGF